MKGWPSSHVTFRCSCRNGKKLFAPPFGALGVPLAYYPFNGDLLDYANIYDATGSAGIDGSSFIADAIKGAWRECLFRTSL